MENQNSQSQDKIEENLLDDPTFNTHNNSISNLDYLDSQKEQVIKNNLLFDAEKQIQISNKLINQQEDLSDKENFNNLNLINTNISQQKANEFNLNLQKSSENNQSAFLQKNLCQNKNLAEISQTNQKKHETPNNFKSLSSNIDSFKTGQNVIQENNINNNIQQSGQSKFYTKIQRSGSNQERLQNLNSYQNEDENSIMSENQVIKNEQRHLQNSHQRLSDSFLLDHIEEKQNKKDSLSKVSCTLSLDKKMDADPIDETNSNSRQYSEINQQNSQQNDQQQINNALLQNNSYNASILLNFSLDNSNEQGVKNQLAQEQQNILQKDNKKFLKDTNEDSILNFENKKSISFFKQPEQQIQDQNSNKRENVGDKQGVQNYNNNEEQEEEIKIFDDRKQINLQPNQSQTGSNTNQMSANHEQQIIQCITGGGGEAHSILKHQEDSVRGRNQIINENDHRNNQNLLSSVVFSVSPKKCQIAEQQRLKIQNRQATPHTRKKSKEQVDDISMKKLGQNQFFKRCNNAQFEAKQNNFLKSNSTSANGNHNNINEESVFKNMKDSSYKSINPLKSARPLTSGKEQNVQDSSEQNQKNSSFIVRKCIQCKQTINKDQKSIYYSCSHRVHEECRKKSDIQCPYCNSNSHK